MELIQAELTNKTETKQHASKEAREKGRRTRSETNMRYLENQHAGCVSKVSGDTIEHCAMSVRIGW